MRVKFLLILCANCFFIHFAIAKSTQDTGYLKPASYFYVHNSEEMRELVQRFLPMDPVIVEGGAYDGSETRIMAMIWPNGHIHSFEPIETLYKNTVANTGNLPNTSVYKLALGAECAKKEIYLALDPDNLTICMSSSLYPPKDHLLYYGPIFQGTETVEVITLDEWVEQNRIQKIDLLWFDLQGFELSAFKGAEKILSQVSAIMTEVEFSELYEGQPMYREVKSWLEGKGFVLVGGDFTFPKDPNQHFGDCLFVRRELLKL